MAIMADSGTNATAGTIEQVETLDHIERRRNHPLYLNNSDTPGCILTSVQLTGTENYSLWSRSMLINLRAKSKLGFVLEICRKGDYRGEMEEQWEKCNAFMLAWIMNTVSKELLNSIVYATDAAMVWADLKERFDKSDFDDESFAYVGKAYAMIMAYESQRLTASLHIGNSMPEQLNGYPPDWKFKRKLGTPANLMHHGRHQDAVNAVNHVPTVKTEMELRDEFAPADVMMKGKNVESDTLLNTQLTFTPSQYNRILHMLERKESGTSSGKASDSMANMAGMITVLSVKTDSTQFKAETGKENWIVDSGATCHMTSKLDRFSHASSCVNKVVHLPNGEVAQVSHTGYCTTINGRILDNVLVVPAFKHNLLSVSKLTRQLHCSVNFFPEFFVLQDLSTGRVKGIGKESGGLYYLPTALQCEAAAALCEEAKGNQAVLTAALQCSSKDELLWHNRLPTHKLPCQPFSSPYKDTHILDSTSPPYQNRAHLHV
uniref:Uncharacterized protein n=1 Tax=Solanum melongena TaxID=223891 RepID=A0A060Q1M1_SOLME|nr:hypothetical protein [Solanum melongena]